MTDKPVSADGLARPVAWLLHYRERTHGGSVKSVSVPSFEPEPPAIMLPYDADVASRELLSAEPLYASPQPAPPVGHRPVTSPAPSELSVEASGAEQLRARAWDYIKPGGVVLCDAHTIRDLIDLLREYDAALRGVGTTSEGKS